MGERTRKRKNGKDAVPSKEVTAAHRYFISYKDPEGKQRRYRFYTANPVFPVDHEAGASEEVVDGKELVSKLKGKETSGELSLPIPRDGSFGKIFKFIGPDDEIKIRSIDSEYLLDEIEVSGPVKVRYEGKSDVPTSKLNDPNAIIFTRRVKAKEKRA